MAANRYANPEYQSHGDGYFSVPGDCEIEAVKYLVAYINEIGEALKNKECIPRFGGYGNFEWGVKLYATAIMIPMDEQLVLKPLRSSLVDTFKEQKLNKAELKTLDYAFNATASFCNPEDDEFLKLVLSTCAYRSAHGNNHSREEFRTSIEGRYALQKALEDAGRIPKRYALRSKVSLTNLGASDTLEDCTARPERKHPIVKIEPVSTGPLSADLSKQRPCFNRGEALQRTFSEKPFNEKPLSVAGGLRPNS